MVRKKVDNGDDMARETTNITLSAYATELLRTAGEGHPGMSPEELIEVALADRYGNAQGAVAGRLQTPAEIGAWLDELSSLSSKIPPQPGQTFPRDMIYQDHDR